MKHILSIQSHVVYGHAGNAAAVFPLQLLGHQVSPLNLLQFSNHTGYGSVQGKVISAEELDHVFSGLKSIGIIDQLDCIITGYIGSKEQVQVIAQFINEIKAINPKCIYCCDPVMGDVHTGMYVKPEVATALQDRLVPLADIITPNQYELSILAGTSINSLDDVLQANKIFLSINTKVLATSVFAQDKMTGLLFQETVDKYSFIQMPTYDIEYTVRGTGDVLTAVFMGNYLNSLDYTQALETSANTLHAMVKYTHEHHCRELAVVASQSFITDPSMTYRCELVRIAI